MDFKSYWKKENTGIIVLIFLVDLTAKVLAIIPPWVRVFTVQRNIPILIDTSGLENGNLRNIDLQRMKENFNRIYQFIILLTKL